MAGGAVKVLHVIPGISVFYGGPSKATIELCREIQRHGFDVEIATTDADLQGNLPVPLGAPIDEHGVTLWVFRSPAFAKYGYSPDLTRWLRQHVREYRLLHLHGFFSYPLLPAAFFAKQYDIPYIVRPIGHLNPWSLHQRGARKRLFFELFGRTLLRGAAAIHATSELERRSLARLGFGEKAVVIPLGVDLPHPARLAREPAAPPSPPRLLFLSRIDPKKGLPALLEAVRLIKDRGQPIVLTIAGTGDAPYLQAMKDLVRHLAIEQEVRFSGFVVGAEKSCYLAESDVFVLPSYDENFGLAVAEAMAAGLPVIVSDGVALAREVADAGAGLVVPAGSVDALCQAILRLTSDEETRRTMGRRARALVERWFTWDRVGHQLADLYQTILRHGQRHSALRADAIR